MIFYLAGSIFLGWALGANDSANIFGAAVSSKMIRYRLSTILIAVFVIIGALMQGGKGLHTLSGITSQSIQTAFITSLAAALTVTLMTAFKLPISTSQSVVGSIIGVGIMQLNINLRGLFKVVICWIFTPIGSFIMSIIIYLLISFLFRKLNLNMFLRDSLIKIGLIIAGCYAAYALGANNVANVTGVFVGNLLTPYSALLIGGFSIAIGALSFSKKVMMTVGKSIVKLDSFSALVVVLANSITVHAYAIIGVPVSTSQAVVGCVLGIGVLKGSQTINFNVLMRVFSGWLLTPVISCFFSIMLYFLFHLRYIP
jgi:inorganic phosphate transporter, PiT family